MTKKLTIFPFYFKTIIDMLNFGRYIDSLNDAAYIDQLLAKKTIFIKFWLLEFESWISFFSCMSGRKPIQIWEIYVPLEKMHLHP